MLQGAFFGNPQSIERVFAQGRREQVASRVRLYPHVVEREGLGEHLPQLENLQVIFATWGMPALTPEELDQLQSLQAVFYAAGSVQAFARPLLERQVVLSSAWRANARPVAEFTLAQILLATKATFQMQRQARPGPDRRSGIRPRGNFGATVALLGAGAIGRQVIELLRPFTLRVVVFDPFLSEPDAAALGVEKVSLEEAFAQGLVVSNHLANLPATVGMLRGEHFALMAENATFINTGRGATVDEPAMIEVLRDRPDLTVLLDVTFPEPPVKDSPLYTLPNVFLTPHIAGSLGDEVVRMADYAIAEFDRWQQGEPLEHRVDLAMLATMA